MEPVITSATLTGHLNQGRFCPLIGQCECLGRLWDERANWGNNRHKLGGEQRDREGSRVYCGQSSPSSSNPFIFPTCYDTAVKSSKVAL